MIHRSIAIAGACCLVILGVTGLRFAEAQGRQALVSTPAPATAAPTHAVPAELRRAHAGTCEGYNLELEHAAGIAMRTGNQGEATRLMGMRQPCSAAPVVARSAK